MSKINEHSLNTEELEVNILKRRIGKFFQNEDGEMVFALKEDDEGEIHYRYCNYDTETYQLSEGKFYKEFSEQV